MASEFRYREPPLVEGRPGAVRFAVGRDGRYAGDAALLRGRGQRIASVVNVQHLHHCARIRRGAADAGGAGDRRRLDQGLHLPAGSARLPRHRRSAAPGAPSVGAKEQELVTALIEVPRLISTMLRDESRYRASPVACRRPATCSISAAARSYPLALEGALKLKEISYIHAEGYAAGELKHGPIALIDENVPVIVVAPDDDLLEKTISNVQEVAARGGPHHSDFQRRSGQVGCELAGSHPHPIGPSVDQSDHLVRCRCSFSPIIPAAFMGTDVDQPRNLAKSVTVE